MNNFFKSVNSQGITLRRESSGICSICLTEIMQPSLRNKSRKILNCQLLIAIYVMAMMINSYELELDTFLMYNSSV